MEWVGVVSTLPGNRASLLQPLNAGGILAANQPSQRGLFAVGAEPEPLQQPVLPDSDSSARAAAATSELDISSGSWTDEGVTTTVMLMWSSDAVTGRVFDTETPLFSI